MTDLNLTHIRNIRREKNFSQVYLASKLGITQKAYSDLENGKTCLSFERMKKLADTLQTTIGELCPIRCNCKADSRQFYQLKQYLADQNIPLPKKFK